jgi:hypothetical protein
MPALNTGVYHPDFPGSATQSDMWGLVCCPDFFFRLFILAYFPSGSRNPRPKSVIPLLHGVIKSSVVEGEGHSIEHLDIKV